MIRSLLIVAALAVTLLAPPALAGNESVRDELQSIYQAIYSMHDKAEQGDPRAAFFISSLYFNGIFLPGDRQQAMHFLQVAADGEDPDGLYYLGLHYHHGVEVEQDDDMAERMIRRAAELGHDPASQAATWFDDN